MSTKVIRDFLEPKEFKCFFSHGIFIRRGALVGVKETLEVAALLLGCAVSPYPAQVSGPGGSEGWAQARATQETQEQEYDADKCISKFSILKLEPCSQNSGSPTPFFKATAQIYCGPICFIPFRTMLPGVHCSRQRT